MMMAIDRLVGLILFAIVCIGGYAYHLYRLEIAREEGRVEMVKTIGHQLQKSVITRSIGSELVAEAVRAEEALKAAQ